MLGKSATARFGAVTATLYATATGALMLIPPASPSRAGRSSQTEMRRGLGLDRVPRRVRTVLAFVFFYEGVSRIGASRATAFALLVPIFGVLGSVLVLGRASVPAPSSAVSRSSRGSGSYRSRPRNRSFQADFGPGLYKPIKKCTRNEERV